MNKSETNKSKTSKSEMSKSEKWAFLTMGLAAVNIALMASGFSPPGILVEEVSRDPMLGASIGAMTGLGIGGALSAIILTTKEATTTGISLLRGKFIDNPNNPKKPKL